MSAYTLYGYFVLLTASCGQSPKRSFAFIRPIFWFDTVPIGEHGREMLFNPQQPVIGVLEPPLEDRCSASTRSGNEHLS